MKIIKIIWLAAWIFSVQANVDIIDTQLQRADKLNELSYRIELTKELVELAKVKAECRQQGGCKSDDEGINNQDTSNEQINSLQILSIINNNVIFEDLQGRYTINDEVLPGVLIVAIENNQVTLKTKKGLKKIIGINWAK